MARIRLALALIHELRQLLAQALVLTEFVALAKEVADVDVTFVHSTSPMSYPIALRAGFRTSARLLPHFDVARDSNTCRPIPSTPPQYFILSYRMTFTATLNGRAPPFASVNCLRARLAPSSVPQRIAPFLPG